MMAVAVAKLPLTHQTMFAELIERCRDADFDQQLPENGSVVQVTAKAANTGTTRATRRMVAKGSPSASASM